MRKVVCLLGLVFLFSIGRALAQDVFEGRFVCRIFLSSLPAPASRGPFIFNCAAWRRRVRRVESHQLGQPRRPKWVAFMPARSAPRTVDATALTYLAGPKITLFRRSKFSPFAQALFGFVNTNPGFNQTAINHNTFAMSPGVGLDWNATHHFGIRLGQTRIHLLARIPTSTNQVNWNNFRYSAGVVFRF